MGTPRTEVRDKKPANIDAAEVRRFARLAFPLDANVEIRGCHASRQKGTVSRVLLGTDAEGAVKAARELAGEGLQVYWTLNPLGRTTGRGGAATDADVLHRRRLLIDADPCRPKHTSATTEEKRHAFDLARWVYCWLTDRGWPRPACVNSGNGYHLLYRMNLPNDAKSRDLVQRFLRGLNEHFGSAVASIDTVVYNAARISKLPGTWARKGEDTAERPHRLASLACAGEAVTVDASLIEGAADDLPPLKNPVLERKTTPPLRSGGRASKETRILQYLGRLPAGVQGQYGSNPCYWAARVLCWGFRLGVEDAVGILMAHYSPRCDPPWTEKEVRHKCLDAASKPFSKPFGWMDVESNGARRTG